MIGIRDFVPARAAVRHVKANGLPSSECCEAVPPKDVADLEDVRECGNRSPGRAPALPLPAPGGDEESLPAWRACQTIGRRSRNAAKRTSTGRSAYFYSGEEPARVNLPTATPRRTV